MTPEKTQIANLIKLAKADGELDHKEVMLIYGIAHKNGIGKFDMDEIIARADSLETNVPQDEAERIRYFYQLLILATVDLKVDDDEAALLKRIGADMGLDEERVGRAIQHTIENHKTDLTDQEIASIFN